MSVWCIVGKLPLEGHSKTRLCNEIGVELGLQFYESFIEDFFSGLSLYIQNRQLHFFGTPHIRSTKAYFEGILAKYGLKNFRFYFQKETDFFSRLQDIYCLLEKEFDREIICLTGTDIPDFPFHHLPEMESMSDKEVFIGPDEDGGFYFLATRAPNGKIFEFDRMEGMQGKTILEKLVNHCRRLDLEVMLLPEWSDIDTLEDLRKFANRSKDSKCSRTRDLYDKCFPSGGF